MEELKLSKTNSQGNIIPCSRLVLNVSNALVIQRNLSSFDLTSRTSPMKLHAQKLSPKYSLGGTSTTSNLPNLTDNPFRVSYSESELRKLMAKHRTKEYQGLLFIINKDYISLSSEKV
jgi:hypothetical protein